ncbi:MAG TPA: site-specific DNA-methyltransferase [Polyangiaceae bacterium]|jgi:site-specific DNA-methyltransferase (adenine-specific)
MAPSRAPTLSWEGKDAGFEAAEAAPPRRAWATEDATGWLLEGDNLRVLRGLASTHAGAVTLAYMDPPFFTNREHAAWLRKAGAPRTSRGPRTRVHAFDDRWADLPAYLDALGARLAATRELLAPHGSIVVHVDPKTSHYVRVLGDEIFGADAFASEIVWRYRRWPSKTPNFQRVHDVLLRWRKDTAATPRWNQPYEPLAASTLATWGTNKQRAVFAKDGRRARSSSTAEKTAGVPMGDVWEIGVIAPIARERTGYPSQKPEALLERIVGALSNAGDTVLDPYAGSGTTLAVAHRMGRSFLGIDASPLALRTTRERLEASGSALEECAFVSGATARAS